MLGIDTPIFDPADDEEAFVNRPSLAGVVPAADHVGRFVVLAEPIADGGIGRAYISSVCPAWLNVASESDTCADVIADQCGYLASGESGAAQILWKESGRRIALISVGLSVAVALAVSFVVRLFF